MIRGEGQCILVEYDICILQLHISQYSLEGYIYTNLIKIILKAQKG